MASATSTNVQELCHPFVSSGSIHCHDQSILIDFEKGLLDTGAQGSNLVSQDLYSRLPCIITNLSRPLDRVVRLGDAHHIAIQLEVPLDVAIVDSSGQTHRHCLWYCKTIEQLSPSSVRNEGG